MGRQIVTKADVAQKKLEAGNVVRLKSNNDDYIQYMTVENIADNRIVSCVWFDKNNVLNRSDFQLTSLTFVR